MSTATPDLHADAGHPRRWLILAVLVVAVIVVVLDNTILNVALRVLSDPHDGLGASQGELAWMINSYTLAFAGLLFAFGVIGDRVGRKRMLLIGMTVFGVGSLLSAYAQSSGQLIGYRALMGAGAAAMMPSTLSLVRSVFPDHEFPRAIGVWSGAVGIGGAVGPIVGGSLLEKFWWGSVFLVNVPIVAVGLVAIALLAPESYGRKGRPDLVGMALSVIALVALSYGIIEAGDSGSWTGLKVWGPIVVGFAGLAAFVRWESRTPYASLDMRLFRNPRFSSAAAIVAILFFAVMGLFFFLTFYIQLVRGRTPLQTGLMFLAFGLGMVAFGPMSNSLARRLGARTLGLGSLIVTGLVFVAIAQLSVHTPLWVVVVLLFLQAIGIANLTPPAMTTLIESVPRERAGVASALGNTMRQVGGALGVAVLGTVMAQAYQHRIAGGAPGLPSSARTSLTATYGALEKGQFAPAQAHQILTDANGAFVGAMEVTAYVAAGVVLVGMIIVARYFPGRTSPLVERPAEGSVEGSAEGSADEPVAVPARDR